MKGFRQYRGGSGKRMSESGSGRVWTGIPQEKEKGERRKIGNLPGRFKTQETMVLAQHKVAVARTGAMDKPARGQPS